MFQDIFSNGIVRLYHISTTPEGPRVQKVVDKAKTVDYNYWRSKGISVFMIE